MSILERLKENSDQVQNNEEEVINEIVEYFRNYLNSEQFEQWLERACTDKNIASKREFTMNVEFWGYQSGCSGTQFEVAWHSWKSEPYYGYESYTYKGVNLNNIQRTVGDRLLNLLTEKMREIGFKYVARYNESWLKYFNMLVTIYW